MNWATGIFKGTAVTGMIFVLTQHVEMAWWEGFFLSFGVMALFGCKE